MPTGSFHDHENNFDFLRFFAASLVVFSHCYFLLGRKDEEPFLLTTGYDDGGAIAVGIFFVISGYLISASFLNSRSRGSFLLKRALRIFPALAVAVIFTTFVLGPLVTSMGVVEYLAQSDTWAYLQNMLLLTRFELPGVFEGNPYARVVNGSLWTLPVEMTMYLGVLLLGSLGFLRRGLVFLPLAVLAAGQLWLLYGPGVESFLANKLFQLGLLFFSGAAYYLYRDKVPWRAWIAACLVLALVLTFRTPVGMVVYFLTLPYLILYLAYAPIPYLARFGKYGDFSYGIYIFSFPLQQLNVQVFGPQLDILQLLVISYVPTLLLAALSWHLVEAPAMKLKRLFALPAQPGRAAPGRAE